MSEDVFLRVVEGEILRDTVFAVRHSARNVGCHVSALLRRRLPGDLRAHVLSCAPSTRPWPAIMPSSGLVKPNSRIETAICATCWSLCMRAFLA